METKRELYKQLKQQIIDTLFPYHGKNLVVGDDIFVDIMGSTVIEDNVTIGNGCTIAGNIKISKNVKVGNNVRLQSIGHHKYYKKRRLPEGKPPREDDLVDTIVIEKNVTLANGTKVIPNIVVDVDTTENEIYTGKKKQRI